MNAAELLCNLESFTGTEQYHSWSAIFPRSVLTDGAKYLGDHAECYWFFDLIAASQALRQVGSEPFQVWTILRDAEGSSAKITCDDGNDHIVYTQHVSYTDFPLAIYSLYATRNERGGIIILLKSEY